jgi:serine/threonine protein kinase
VTQETFTMSGFVADAPYRRPTMDWENFFRNYRTPDFVPGFTILNKLGSGVFGEVYKAKRTSIGKLYALKFLRLQDERIQEQVIRELDSVDHFAQVDHPNLVSIEDRGEVCGIPYIVMGYAGDETLKTVLQDGPLPMGRAIPLFRQILRGVKALHEHSIIHFDLKPANVFIKGDVARVGDYGLSKLMTESRATLSMGRGTPYYMAPEMLQRRGDARSDVYSLGVILYEMLVGDVPFKGETEWEILKRHETQAPEIPGWIPNELRLFLTQCLDKDPASRFNNAGAQLSAFEACQPGGMSGRAPIAQAASNGSPRSSPSLSSPSVRTGEMVGRLAARGRVTMDRVRSEIRDVLNRVREETGHVWQAARETYANESDRRGTPGPGEQVQSEGANLNGKCGATWRLARQARVAAKTAARQAKAVARQAKATAKANRQRRFGLWRGLGRLFMLPFTVIGWTLRHAVQVFVVLAIVVALCVAVHLGLKAAIL